MKPYAVQVTIAGQSKYKEFTDKQGFLEFLKKAEELKKTKAPSLEIKIVRNGLPKPKKEVIDDPREESPAHVPIIQNGKRVRNFRGELLYKVVPVAKKPKVLYCPYCLAYKEFKVLDVGYGYREKACPDCHITVRDFNVRTANQLWEGKRA